MSLDLERAPTLDEILRGCIDAFDDGGRVRDPRLVRLFLLVHAWYLPSAELVAKLLRTLEESRDSAEGPSLRLRVSHLVRFWLTAFPAELELSPELWGGLRELKEALGGGPGGGAGAIAHLEALQEAGGLQELLSPGGPPEPPPPGVAPRRKASLLLEHLEAAELATHLTHLEHRAFCRVRLQDYRSFARSGGPGGSAALQRVVGLFNGVSRWAQLLVLSPTAAPQRARVLARFLHVAQRLLELRNFHTLMAVVGGLGHSSITRLHHTLALLPPEDTKLWQRLSACLSSSGNFRRYRRLLQEAAGGGAAGGGAGGFRLPALGVHLRDLVALQEALPDWGDPARRRPHPAKLRQLGAELGALLLARGHRPPGGDGVDEGVLDLLTVSLELPQTEEELYRLSLQREPRTAKRPPAAQAPPACSPPLEELGLPEPPPPDPAVLREHVEKMVESVFRNFDVDGDGRISREEFGILRENFPHLHLHHFGELDTDGDGSLSRGEVVSFFLRCAAEPPARAVLVHSFQDSSALRAACRHCRAPILGIYKQGLKCRTCGVRCHRQCRERLRVECRRRARSFAAEPPPGPPPARGDPPKDPPGPPPASSKPPRGRSFSFSLPWSRRSVGGSSGTPPETPKTPPGTPPDVQELEDGVFDIHL